MTKIEWCDETINPIQDRRKGQSGRGYHCTKTSPGCQHCYAERINKIRGNGFPFDNSSVEFELIQSELDKLDKWKRHKNVFVQSMGDLFHEAVPRTFIARILDSAFRAYIDKGHVSLILTKRAQRMADEVRLWAHIRGINLSSCDGLFFGITICNQPEADEKISIFLQVPGKKFLSIEPMLSGIDIFRALPKCEFRRDGSCKTCNRTWDKCWAFDAVILGGETGPGARPMSLDWARSVRDQSLAAGVPFFFKGWGEWAPLEIHAGGDLGRDLRIGKTVHLHAPGNPEGYFRRGDAYMSRVGRSKSGRLLDGMEYNGLPWTSLPTPESAGAQRSAG